MDDQTFSLLAFSLIVALAGIYSAIPGTIERIIDFFKEDGHQNQGDEHIDDSVP
ncbi:hypothetical protein GF382_03035 [Candidatus Falkowbacteria bacterium]|nr:hypothetical protein [Candidatus Falkowbacteria bacterium]